jgi:hypothetical protein
LAPTAACGRKTLDGGNAVIVDDDGHLAQVDLLVRHVNRIVTGAG